MKDLYSYLDKVTALQCNEDDEYNIGDAKALDYELVINKQVNQYQIWHHIMVNN